MPVKFFISILLPLLLFQVGCKKRIVSDQQVRDHGVISQSEVDLYYRQVSIGENPITHQEMTKRLKIEFDSVRVVEPSLQIWSRLEKKLGEQLLQISRAVPHTENEIIETDILVFPFEFEVHFLQNNKLVLLIGFNHVTDVLSFEIFGKSFPVNEKDLAKRFNGLSDQLRRVLADNPLLDNESGHADISLGR